MSRKLKNSRFNFLGAESFKLMQPAPNNMVCLIFCLDMENGTKKHFSFNSDFTSEAEAQELKQRVIKLMEKIS